MIQLPQNLNHQQSQISDLPAWIDSLQKNGKLQDAELFRKGCEYIQTKIATGKSFDSEWFQHGDPIANGQEIVDILANLDLDDEVLLAGLIYRTVREEYCNLEDVATTFGTNISLLIDGVLKMSQIDMLQLTGSTPLQGETTGQLESIRHMLITMIDDVRVVVIKLSEKICALRVAKIFSPERRLRMAEEVEKVYAPLAMHLGIGQLSSLLQDLAFFYLQSDVYKAISSSLDSQKGQRKELVDTVVRILQEGLHKRQIECEVAGRVKHIYSVWQKMQRKGIELNEVFDVRAVRILVSGSETTCYRTLDFVHSLWTPINGEYDDYIISPKQNGYRALHTAVFGPKNKVFEVQIRTKEMDHDAEFGVCAHWRYKNNSNDNNLLGDAGYEKKIMWLKGKLKSLDSVDSNTGIRDFVEGSDDEIIYVITIGGHTCSMSLGSTPLDFAYRLHTEIGNHCVAARVNGQMVSLNTQLKNGDQVEILTSDLATPSQEWLDPQLGFIRSTHASERVRNWLRKKIRKESDKKTSHWAFVPDLDRLQQQDSWPYSGLESDDFKIVLGTCCIAEPRDEIFCLVTEYGQAVVHKIGCQLVKDLKVKSDTKTFKAYWVNTQGSFPCILEIHAQNKVGLIMDITLEIAKMNGDIVDFFTNLDNMTNKVIIKIVFSLSNPDDVKQVIKQIESVTGISKIQNIQAKIRMLS